MRRGPRATKVPEVQRGLGFSLCAAPLDAYCPQILDKGSEVQTMSSRDNQCRFQTEEHTWSLECIYIGRRHIRVMRIGVRIQSSGRQSPVFWNPWNYWCLECTRNHQRVLTVMSRIRRGIKPLLQHNSGNNLIFVPWLRSVEAVYVDSSQESNTFLSSKWMDNSTKVCVEHGLEFKYSKGMECT